MHNLLIAGALLAGLALATPGAAHAGFFFSFSEPGFGIAVGVPPPRPSYYYPPPPVVYAPPPVVYAPPPVVYGGWAPYHGYSYRGHRSHGWGHGYRGRGRRWR